jgi:uncharacterized protein (TIGR03435 family)
MRAISLIGFAALTAAAAWAQLTAVDIRPSAPNTILEMRSRFFRGHYELKNATLVDLIDTAWGVDPDRIVGGPDWLDTDRFDVTATAPADSTPDALKIMLRSLLAARFHLVVREDTRFQPAYAMTAVGKLKLKQAGAEENSGCQTRLINPTSVVSECRNMTMAAFAKALPAANFREASGYLFNYPVVDRTRLTAAWDFTLQWTPRYAMRANRAMPEAVTIFDAFEKQLGLKLNFIRILARVIVVERAAEIEPTPSDKPPAPLEFEVADIKPDTEPRTPEQCSNIAIQPGGRVRIHMSLKWLISEAWGAMDPAKIVGAPKSIDDTCFVIQAKAPAEEGAATGWNGPVWNGVDIHSMRMMLRALLVDRFKLAAHTEDRLISGYALLAAKPKLRKANPANRASCREGRGDDGKDPRIANPMASRLISCRNMTLARFAAEMNRIFVELPPVVDSTGLIGRYDMTINFSPTALLPKPVDPATIQDAVATEPNGVISFSEALSKQLGLKFESRKVMAPVLVIDHVNEMPTEN